MEPSQTTGTPRNTPTVSDHDRYYTRHLPHQIPEGYPIFVTWNIRGALPKNALNALESARERLERTHPRGLLPEDKRRLLIARRLFAIREKYLDNCRAGFGNLGTAEAAHIVCESLLWGVPERYQLFSFSVMPNHVHGLLTPMIKPITIMQSLKGFTSRQINLIENRVGRPFWQDESYDHYARNEEEVGRIVNYIELNPVRAGLCSAPDAWPWSSGALRPLLSWEPGAPFDPQWKTAARKFLRDAYNGTHQHGPISRWPSFARRQSQWPRPSALRVGLKGRRTSGFQPDPRPDGRFPFNCPTRVHRRPHFESA